MNSPAMKYAYKLVCVTSGRPNGVVGTYKTRSAVLVAKQRERQTTRIKREKVTPANWETLKG